MLLAGEAGVGKTRLAEELADGTEAPVLRGTAGQAGRTPYAPIVSALRSYLRTQPRALDDCGPLRPHLALLLPELGAPAVSTDRATLFEAVRSALAQVSGDRHALVVLDDLQWSDEATLELLSALAEPLAELSLLVVAAYRSDGLSGDHRLRRLRHELRRARRLEELTIGPLDAAQTAELLGSILEDKPSPSLPALFTTARRAFPSS